MSIKKVIKPTPAHRIGIYHMLSARNIKRARESVLKSHELNSPEWFTLGMISEQSNITAKELAHELQANPTYVTATLGNLRRKQLISSHKSSADSRYRVLEVTPKGRVLVQVVGNAINATIEKGFSNFDEEAVKNYFAVTQAISECPRQ